MYTYGVRAEYYVNEMKKKEKQIFTAYYIKEAVDVLHASSLYMYSLLIFGGGTKR